MIKNAPFYVSNHSVHRELKVSTIEETAKIPSKRFHYRRRNHTNRLTSALGSDTIYGNTPGKLERIWC